MSNLYQITPTFIADVSEIICLYYRKISNNNYTVGIEFKNNQFSCINGIETEQNAKEILSHVNNKINLYQITPFMIVNIHEIHSISNKNVSDNSSPNCYQTVLRLKQCNRLIDIELFKSYSDVKDFITKVNNDIKELI